MSRPSIPLELFKDKPVIRIRKIESVVNNYRLFRSKTEKTDTECAVVLKGDVHGLIMKDTAPALYNEGARHFFIEEMFEGIELRNILPFEDAKIYALAGILKGEEKLFSQYNLIPCINSIGQLERWNTFNKETKNAGTLIHLDSKMNRLGLNEESVKFLSENFDKLTNNLNIEGYLSHFFDIKGDDHTNCDMQLDVLNAYLNILPKRKVSMACTDSVILLDNQKVNFDMVRIGIGLVGGAPSKDKPLSEKSEYTLEIYARYSQKKNVRKGETIGYGGAFTVKRDTKIVLVHIGYKDGYLRNLSGLDNKKGGYMSIGGYKAQVIGKISLGATVLDVTDIPDEVLDSNYYAEVAGPTVDMRELADISGCYEIMISLGRENRKFTDYTMDQFRKALE